jgi:DNA-3-methyladenine glycosylase II
MTEHGKATAHLRSSDPVLAAIIERIGPPEIAHRPATFWALARSIVFQQLNGKAAKTIFERLEQAAGGELTAHSLLALTDAQLRAAGLSKQKASYLRDLAQRTASGELDFAALPALTDLEVIEQLTRIKGIGVWTAQMFLIFALRRADVMPTADYGIRAAIKRAYRMRKLPTPKRMLRLAEKWRPYCSLACWYLWRSVDVTTVAERHFSRWGKFTACIVRQNSCGGILTRQP